jgi:HSP20 family protein
MDRDTTTTTRTKTAGAPRKAATSSTKGTKVPVRLGQRAALLDRIREVQDRITRRAFEVFHENGGEEGRDLDHWLTAEREVLWKPSFELSERDGVLSIRADVAGMEPGDLEVTVTPDRLVLTGETRHEHSETKGQVHYSEFSSGSLYREIAFPRPVDPSAVKAALRNGLLEITAPAAEEPGPEEPATERGGRRSIEIVEA